jgi:peptidyl-prolyl cis-trans isomerase C
MTRSIAVAFLIVSAACRPTTPSDVPVAETRAPTAGAFVDAAEPQPEPRPEPRAPKLDGVDPSMPDLPQSVVAEVGATTISTAAFRAIYDLKLVKYTIRNRVIPPTADARYRRSITERLIWHEVLRQEAEQLGVTYDPARLAEREAQQQHGIADWKLHLERRGETEHSLREMYVAELREEAILGKLGKLEVTRAEIEAEYDEKKEQWRSAGPQVRASQISFRAAPDDPVPDPTQPIVDPEAAQRWAKAKAKAWKVYALAKKKGADFAALAREHSTGSNAWHSGDVGIFSRERMASEASEVAFAMKVGQISKPVKTKFGYHIIKVTGRWPAGDLPLSALEDQIVERLRQRKLHEGRAALKADLLGRYRIVDHVAATLRP